MSKYSNFELVVKAYCVDSMLYQTMYYEHVTSTFRRYKNGCMCMAVSECRKPNNVAYSWHIYEEEPGGLLTYVEGSRVSEHLTHTEVIRILVANEGCSAG